MNVSKALAKLIVRDRGVALFQVLHCCLDNCLHIVLLCTAQNLGHGDPLVFHGLWSSVGERALQALDAIRSPTD